MLGNRLDDGAPNASPPATYRISATELSKAHYKPFRRSECLEIALERLREGDAFPSVPKCHAEKGEESHPVGSDLRLDLLQSSPKFRTEVEIEDSTNDKVDVEESREATNEDLEDDTREEGVRDQIVIATHQNTPHEAPAKPCFEENNDLLCKDHIASRTTLTIRVEPSLSSEESGKETATYNAFTDSSDESDSSSDGYSTESSTKINKALVTDTNKEEKHPKGTLE